MQSNYPRTAVFERAALYTAYGIRGADWKSPSSIRVLCNIPKNPFGYGGWFFCVFYELIFIFGENGNSNSSRFVWKNKPVGTIWHPVLYINAAMGGAAWINVYSLADMCFLKKRILDNHHISLWVWCVANNAARISANGALKGACGVNWGWCICAVLAFSMWLLLGCASLGSLAWRLRRRQARANGLTYCACDAVSFVCDVCSCIVQFKAQPQTIRAVCVVCMGDIRFIHEFQTWIVICKILLRFVSASLVCNRTQTHTHIYDVMDTIVTSPLSHIRPKISQVSAQTSTFAYNNHPCRPRQ